MVRFGLQHLMYLLFTLCFLIGGSFLIRKLPKKAQTAVFITMALIGSGGIFYRYGISFGKKFTPGTLLMEMLQVCNFNFILLPLCLIPKFEYARQYSFYFSMIAASTVFLSYGNGIASKEWYDISVINFWINHLMAVALPLFMFTSGRLRPQKKYVPWITLGVIVYFTVAYIGDYYLINYLGMPPEQTFSFIYNTTSNPIFVFCYKLIGKPYFYLYPLLPVLIAYFYLLGFIGRKILDRIEKNKTKPLPKNTLADQNVGK